MAEKFFNSDHGRDLLGRAATAVKRFRGAEKKCEALAYAIKIVSNSPAKFDEAAETNIGWIGRTLSTSVDQLEKDTASEANLDDLYSFFYRVISEFDLTLPNDKELSFELKAFISFARESPEAFSADAQRQIRYADQSMPISILKRLVGSEPLLNLRNVAAFSEKVAAQITQWDAALQKHSTEVSRLEDALKKQETAFNFVGLYQGFDDMASSKRTELRKLRVGMFIAGFAAILPIALELLFVFQNVERFEEVQWAVLASGIPAVSLTVLLVYFFRLAVRSVDSTKLQLLQLELRMTLCRFIQGYSDYAKKLKEGGSDPLTKFENIVFSGIVSTDEKMPSTFDGVDQLASLMKALRSPSA